MITQIKGKITQIRHRRVIGVIAVKNLCNLCSCNLCSMNKILVIDDEEDYTNLVRLSLEPEGFEVISAFDGQTGLKILQQELPELLILDINLPGLDGIAICHRIRNDDRLRQLPIMMLTVRRKDEEQVKGLNTGADDYITKPFQPEELVARVKSLLRRSDKKREMKDEGRGKKNNGNDTSNSCGV